MKPALRIVLITGALLFALLTISFFALSYQNSLIVTAVSIKLKQGEKEPMDPVVLGVGKSHELPDYKIKLRTNDRFLNIDLGTKLDTSAVNWLEFPVNEMLPRHQIQEIMILEDDTISNDLLDRIQVSGEAGQGTHYEWKLTTSRSVEMGVRWFLDTRIGLALLVGMVVSAASATGAAVRALLTREKPTP